MNRSAKVKNYKKRYIPSWITPLKKFHIGERAQSGENFIRVVIPCFDEPDLLGVIQSLCQCEKPRYPVLVVIVINYPFGCSEEIQKRSKSQLNDLLEKLTEKPFQWLNFTLIEAFDLPAKKSGVGLARKIGMDYAAIEIEQDDNSVLVCLDGDCRVQKNYFKSLENHFERYLETPGCSIYYSHTRDDEKSDTFQSLAIQQYEMHLRLYSNMVKKTGAPFGFHTVGSSMAVRTNEYLNLGGMNVKKAGEDFYFLQKFMKGRKFSRLQETTVFPSSRVSKRVPFGTGKAMLAVFESGNKLPELRTYNGEIFEILGEWLNNLEQVYNYHDIRAGKPHEKLYEYLNSIETPRRISQSIENSSNFQTFKNQFYQFFDAFFIMKWARQFCTLRLGNRRRSCVCSFGFCLLLWSSLSAPFSPLSTFRRKCGRGR